MFNKLIHQIKTAFTSCRQHPPNEKIKPPPTDPSQLQVQVNAEISLKNTTLDVSDDKDQMLNSFFTSFVDGVKVAVACLLSVFVPQYCDESGGTCTLSENFSNLTSFNTFVLALHKDHILFSPISSFVNEYLIKIA